MSQARNVRLWRRAASACDGAVRLVCPSQDPDGLQIQRAEELAQAERHAQTVEDEEIKFKQWRWVLQQGRGGPCQRFRCAASWLCGW